MNAEETSASAPNAIPTTTPAPRVRRSVVLAILTVGIICLLIVGWTAATDGVSTATRTLTDLCLPLGLCWLGLIAASIIAWHQRSRSVAVMMHCVLVLLTLAGNRSLGNMLFRVVEMPQPVLSQPEPSQTNSAQTPPEWNASDPYDIIIVLGGTTRLSPNGTPELGCDGERVVSAAQAWHAGATKKIICTGHDPSGVQPPAELTEEILMTLGVPKQAIIKLDGETTSTEMVAIKQHLTESPAQRVGLITSSFHMRRALRLAESQGIDAQPLPVAYRVLSDRGFRIRDFVPNAQAASSVALATKEMLAGLVGR